MSLITAFRGQTIPGVLYLVWGVYDTASLALNLLVLIDAVVQTMSYPSSTSQDLPTPLTHSDSAFFSSSQDGY